MAYTPHLVDEMPHQASAHQMFHRTLTAPFSSLQPAWATGQVEAKIAIVRRMCTNVVMKEIIYMHFSPLK
jgi:hypothetical protein